MLYFLLWFRIERKKIDEQWPGLAHHCWARLALEYCRDRQMEPEARVLCWPQGPEGLVLGDHFTGLYLSMGRTVTRNPLGDSECVCAASGLSLVPQTYRLEKESWVELRRPD